MDYTSTSVFAMNVLQLVKMAMDILILDVLQRLSS